MRAWVVSDTTDEWAEIVRAETRGWAKVMARNISDCEFEDARARRVPALDGDFAITPRHRLVDARCATDCAACCHLVWPEALENPEAADRPVIAGDLVYCGARCLPPSIALADALHDERNALT